MNFNRPLPRATQPRFSEGSQLASVRDARNTARQWSKNKTNTNQDVRNGDLLQAMARELTRLRRRQTGYLDTLIPFHPFKIYKPEVKKIIFTIEGNPVPQSAWMNIEGIGFSFGTDGVLSTANVTIDSTQPTNIDASGNGNVNPLTDGWRIWAVRSGMISYRSEANPAAQQIFSPGTEARLIMPDYSISVEVNGCDGYKIGSPIELPIDGQGFPYEFNPREINGSENLFGGIIPIILPPTFVNNTSNYIFSIWIAPNNSSPIYPCLNGKAFNLDTDNPNAIFPVPTTSLTIPVGAIASQGYLKSVPGGDPKALTPYQILYGNQTSGRYGFYRNSFIDYPPAPTSNPLIYSATLNFRGSWQNDPITTCYFYVGDVVKFETSINIQNSSTVLYVENLFMCGVAGTTADPSVDANWTRISGVRTTTDAGKTPNTH